jgi:hypothetical protein
MSAELRRRYQLALDRQDIREQVESLEALALEAIAMGETLAAPRLVEESLALVHGRESPFSVRERLRLSVRLCAVWVKSGRSARGHKDPSKYWFFHT